jgi:hypothetical protein
VFGYNSVADRKAKPCAFATPFRCKEGFEDPILDVWMNAGSGIFNCGAVSSFFMPGSNMDFAFSGYRLARIYNQVQENLNELRRGD